MMVLATAGMAAGADGARVARPNSRGTDWGGLSAGRLHDRPRLRPSVCLPRIATRARGARPPPRSPPVSFAGLLALGAPRHRSAVRARVLLPPPVRHRRSRRLVLDVLHHGAAALFRPVRAEARRTTASTPLDAGAALLPLSAALLAVAMSAPAIAARIGLRSAMTTAMTLIVAGSAVVSSSPSPAWVRACPATGFVLMGAGLAMLTPLPRRLALSALASEQAGKGSGIVNACTFLAGSVGVTGGAIATEFGGFPAVLGMLALAGLWMPGEQSHRPDFGLQQLAGVGEKHSERSHPANFGHCPDTGCSIAGGKLRREAADTPLGDVRFRMVRSVVRRPGWVGR